MDSHNLRKEIIQNTCWTNDKNFSKAVMNIRDFQETVRTILSRFFSAAGHTCASQWETLEMRSHSWRCALTAGNAWEWGKILSRSRKLAVEITVISLQYIEKSS